jgi:uncharacterized membrane protein YhaH (DUF805 family)
MNWFLKVLKNYAVFNGRARRKEYWFFYLFYMIFMIVLVTIDAMTGSLSETTSLGLLSGIFMLSMIVPGVAVAIRRIHDTDRSGWWILISFIPLIGGIWLLVLMVLDGTSGQNQYGPDPKEEPL